MAASLSKKAVDMQVNECMQSLLDMKVNECMQSVLVVGRQRLLGVGDAWLHACRLLSVNPNTLTRSTCTFRKPNCDKLDLLNKCLFFWG